jgi:mannose-1-phosphate guanylyltransferase
MLLPGSVRTVPGGRDDEGDGAAMRYAMIMAGGSGTRMWPMSRKARPKQLLPLIEGKTLLQIAASRLEGMVPAERRYICTGERYRDAITSSMPKFSNARILGEPEGRDTVNAIGFTAAVLHRQDPNAIFAVLTADHIISPVVEFQRKLHVGFDLVEADSTRFVTFAIRPTYPATGFGYVERGDAVPTFPGAYFVQRFVEKPDEDTAKGYLRAGNFGWNSGMFVFHAGRFLDALSWYKPASYEGLMKIAEAWDTDQQQAVLDEVYPTLPKISVDYAIMEPAGPDDRITICTIDLNVDWTDVGSWPAFGETLTRDEDQNAGNAPAVHLNSHNILCATDDPGHTITTIGCEDLIIVHTADATLICHADQAQRVKDMANTVDPSLR